MHFELRLMSVEYKKNEKHQMKHNLEKHLFRCRINIFEKELHLFKINILIHNRSGLNTLQIV